MMSRDCRGLLALALTLLRPEPAAAAAGIYRNSTPVFTYGERDARGERHACYRAPSIQVLKSGALLAFASAGQATDCDGGNVSIVSRKSTSGGRSWGPIEIVAFVEGEALVNTSPLVDSDGVVHIMTSVNNNDALYLRSTDEGLSWSKPVNLTRQVEPHRVHGTPSTGGSWYAPGPSGGVETKSGILLTAARGPFGNATSPQEYMAAVFSKDKGDTWSVGSPIPSAGAEEPSVTALTDGSIAALSRAGGGVFGLDFSADGGESWKAGKTVNLTGQNLYPCDGATTCVVPDCQGSLLGVGDRLLMAASTTTDTKGRSGMRVFASDDKGESWKLHLTLTPGDWSAGYSSMALVGKNDVACLFESRNCQSVELCPMGINLALFSGDK